MQKENLHSVLITGLGLVIAPGIGGTDLAVLLRRNILGDTHADLPGKMVGQVTDFDREVLIGRRGLRYHTNATLYLMAAARLAMEEAGISSSADSAETIGVVTGTMTSNAALVAEFDQTTLAENPTVVNASKFPETVWNSPPSRLAIRFGLNGINIPVCSGLNSGLDAILLAHEHISGGDESIVLAGGFEELTPYFSVLFDEQAAPYLGEGSAVLVLEQEDTARARKSQPLARIIGGNSCYFPNQESNSAEYQAGRRDLIAGSMADHGVDPTETGIIWHLEFSGRTGRGHKQNPLAIDTLKWTGPTPRIIELTPHLGISGGLAGALAAVVACAPAPPMPHRPNGDANKEIIISEDGHGSLAILIVERLT